MESIPRMERRINKEKLRCKHIIVNIKNINNIEEIPKAYGQMRSLQNKMTYINLRIFCSATVRGELLENVLKLSRSSILGTNHDKSIEKGVSQDFNQDFIIIYLI